MTQRIEKRKLLLFLFIPIIICAAAVFYVLGGGKAATSVTAPTGKLNTMLPDAQFGKDAPKDKMTIYDQAQKDSAHHETYAVKNVAQQLGFSAPDPQAKAITEKLAAINKVINTPQQPVPQSLAPPPAGNSKDVARLEALLRNMQQTGGADPQMAQLNSMLEKISDIQNPERVKDKLKKNPDKPDSVFRAIPVTIDGTQKVVQGGIVRLRLTDSIHIKGMVIPKGQLLFGNAAITNQRLLLSIKDIRLDNAIIPVDFTVYSLDGLPGINAPEAELAGAAGSGADNALQSMQLLTMDESLGAQAAAGGIQAAKSLFSKKVRRIKVKLKNGTPLLLRDNTKKSNI